MTKKLVKTVLVTIACATLVIGGSSVAVNAQPYYVPYCGHNYYLVENSRAEYDSIDNMNHICYYWEERFCMDCMSYFSIEDEWEEGHFYNHDEVCDDCGHVN